MTTRVNMIMPVESVVCTKYKCRIIVGDCQAMSTYPEYHQHLYTKSGASPCYVDTKLS